MRYTVLFSICAILCISKIKIYAQEAHFTVRVDGVEHRFEEDRPSLDFNNVVEFCTTGVWVSYASENYLDPIYTFPNTGTYCPDPDLVHQEFLRSIRFVGLRYNTSATSVTLFSERILSGAAATFVSEINRITFPVKSLVTIGTGVELFQDENFKGRSVCLEYEFYACNGRVCWDSELSPDEFDWDVNSAKSARIGCGGTATLKRANSQNGVATVQL